MVWPILPSLQACPGSNSWSFSGWSLALCLTPTPRLASASVPGGEATGHLPQAARDPGILTLPSLAGERRPQLLPTQGASWAPLPGPSVLLLFGKQMWAGGPAGERSGSGFSPDNAGGHRARGWDCSWRSSGVFREREAGGTGPGPRGRSRGGRRPASAA